MGGGFGRCCERHTPLPVPPPQGGRERHLRNRQYTRINHHRRVRYCIANLRTYVHNDGRLRYALANDFRLRVVRKPHSDCCNRSQRIVIEVFLDRLLPRRANIRKPHAVGRQQGRERMDKHLGHSKGVGDQAGVLAAGAAEAIERVARHIVAALHRNLFDRVGHVLDRDLDESIRHFLGAAAHCAGEFRKSLPHHRGIERQILRRSEDLWKEFGDQLADHHVGIGDGEGAAAPVAGGPRIGAGGIRSDPKTRAIEMQDRTAAGGHRMDQHHRRAHAHAGDLGFERALVFAVEMRHVGRGAAHVEADEMREARFPSGLRHADDPARRTGKDRILALKQFSGRETAGRHHEHQADGVVADALSTCRSLLPPPLRGRGGEGGGCKRRSLWLTPHPVPPPPELGCSRVRFHRVAEVGNIRLQLGRERCCTSLR